MIAPGADLKVYVATRPVDFRKGHDGLAALVQQMFGLDPFNGAAFVFRAKRTDRIKILVWDRTGLVLVHKAAGGLQVCVAAGARRCDAYILGADDRAIRKYALSTAVTMSGASDLSLRVAGSNSTSAAKLRFALASRSDGAALSECAWLPRVQRTEPAYRSLPQGLTIVA